MLRRLCLSCAVLVAWAAAAPASAAGFLEKNFWLPGPGYDGALPACEAALPRITGEFTQTQEKYWALSPVIVGYEHVREVAYSPWAVGAVPRRFCQATALVKDPRFPNVAYRRHAVKFHLTEDAGFASIGWGVTWCVTGYDWNWAYNPGCQMAAP
jgi:hypothetical protein